MSNNDPAKGASSVFQDSLEKLKELNPVAAGIILSAFVAFLAVITLTTFGETVESRIPIVAYFLLIGTAIYVVTAIVKDPALNAIIRWFVILVLVAWCGVFTLGRIYPVNEPLACLSYFWRSCRAVVDEINEARPGRPEIKMARPMFPPTTGMATGRTPLTANQTPAATDQAPADTDQTPVYMQFAGAYDRDDIRTGMRILLAKGWNVQGISGGGQRTSSASGKNEIRFRDARRKQAAERLAADVFAIGLSSRRLDVSQTSAVTDDRLEIWISN